MSVYMARTMPGGAKHSINAGYTRGTPAPSPADGAALNDVVGGDGPHGGARIGRAGGTRPHTAAHGVAVALTRLTGGNPQ
ncbi:hypothetical protein ABT300_25845 [Streptomyces sp. NPDC001027]|uniref:hypothetical protein n=1 Tax=Streptomyces sp. NPDC001027 TaxID=3154771 RepID=UPI0033338F14